MPEINTEQVKQAFDDGIVKAQEIIQDPSKVIMGV